MRLSNFPLCCKSGILWSFPEGDRHEHKKATPKSLRDDFAKKILEAEDEDFVQVIVILNEAQDMARHLIEDELGFKPVFTQATNAYDYISTYVLPVTGVLWAWASDHAY